MPAPSITTAERDRLLTDLAAVRSALQSAIRRRDEANRVRPAGDSARAYHDAHAQVASLREQRDQIERQLLLPVVAETLPPIHPHCFSDDDAALWTFSRFDNYFPADTYRQRTDAHPALSFGVAARVGNTIRAERSQWALIETATSRVVQVLSSSADTAVERIRNLPNVADGGRWHGDYRTPDAARALSRAVGYTTAPQYQTPAPLPRALPRVNSYHGGPPTLVPLFGKKQRNTVPRLAGIEMEIAAPLSDADLIGGRQAFADHVMASEVWNMTADSSINGNGHGIEFVSRPMTLAAWRDHRAAWERFAGAMSAAGWRGHQAKSCGMHIHIGRDSFRDDGHVRRFLAFFRDHKAQWVTLSRRRASDLNQWAAFLPISDAALREKGKKSAPGGWNGETRYTALNARNSATIELRFFRSTLKPGTFYGSLELAMAVLQVTRYAWRVDASAQWGEFCALLPKKYPDAAELVKRASLWAERTAPRVAAAVVDASVNPFETDLLNVDAYDDTLDERGEALRCDNCDRVLRDGGCTRCDG